MLEIVLARAADPEIMTVPLPTHSRNRDTALTGKVLPRDGALTRTDILHRTCAYDLSAVNAGAGTDIHDIIRSVHRVLVVLDHDQSIAEIAQTEECLQQLFIVTLVQANRRLVKNVKHAHQRRTDLGRETDSLAFTSGKRSGRTGQREILQTHILQEPQSHADLVENALRDHGLLAGEREPFQKIKLFRDGKMCKVRDIHAANRDRKHFLF